MSLKTTTVLCFGGNRLMALVIWAVLSFLSSAVTGEADPFSGQGVENGEAEEHEHRRKDQGQEGHGQGFAEELPDQVAAAGADHLAHAHLQGTVQDGPAPSINPDN